MPLYRIGRIWYIDIPSHKGRIRRSAGTADKKEAQEYHDRVKEQLWRLEKLGERPAITWGEAVKRWLHLQERGEPDRYRLRALGIPPESTLPLPAHTVENALTVYTTPGSFNRCLNLIVAIHNAAKIDPPDVSRKRAPPGRTRWLTAEEWERLRKALAEESPLLEQCARFALATGLRENNVLNLEWTRVDLRRRVAFMEARDMKQKRAHGIPLTDAAIDVLRERKGAHERWVFAHPDSDFPLYKASNRAWYEALRKAKLVGFRFHDLRHTFASWAVMSGVRLDELQALGGWKSHSMVQRYAHLAPEHLADAAAKIKPFSTRRS